MSMDIEFEGMNSVHEPLITNTTGYELLPVLSDLDEILDLRNFTVDYEQYPLQIEKKQDRHKEYKKGRQMRLKPEDSHVKFILTFTTAIDLYKIMYIKLKVKRTNSTTNCYDDFVTLHTKSITYYQEVQGSKQISLHANLAELMEEDLDKDIYKLSRHDVKKNQFYVNIEVLFSDGKSSCVDTRNFTVVSGKSGGNTTGAIPLDTTGAKRRRTDDAGGSPCSTGSSDYEGDPHRSSTFLEASKAVIKLLEAEHGKFDNLDAKVIRSGNGDIAYHFILKDQCDKEEYNPGEIIGFTTDKGGKVCIQKLTSSNAREVFLKGVVTESQYLEVNKPKDENVITSTICMLGVVPVQTIGPVYPGDGLYASKDLPGVATPEDYVGNKNDKTLVGFAVERDDCPDDEIHYTQALVSMIGGVFQDLVKRDLASLENTLKDNIDDHSRKHKKRYYFLSVLIVLFSIALGVWLFQRYGIGTMYQRLVCRQGSTGTSEYWYWLQGHSYRGVRFKDCKTVWRKATEDRRFYKRPRHIHAGEMKEKCLQNGTYHYYINLDSCTGILNPGARYMYAVDDKCTKVMKFDEVLGKWDIDKRICALPRCNLFCSHVTVKADRNCDLNAKCNYEGSVPDDEF